MKKGIHPQMRVVVFRDTASDAMFLSRSTVSTKKTITYTDGNEYALCDIEISSASHPFYTGTQKMVDTAGRIERYRRKYNIQD